MNTDTRRHTRRTRRFRPEVGGRSLEGRALLSLATTSAAHLEHKVLRLQHEITRSEAVLDRVEIALERVASHARRTPERLTFAARRLQSRIDRLSHALALSPGQANGGTPAPTTPVQGTVTGSPPASAPPGASAPSASAPATTAPGTSDGGPTDGAVSGSAPAGVTPGEMIPEVLAGVQSSMPQVPTPPAGRTVTTYAWDLSEAPDGGITNGDGTAHVDIFWRDPTYGLTAEAASKILVSVDVVSVTETLDDGSTATYTFPYAIITQTNPLWEPGFEADMGETPVPEPFFSGTYVVPDSSVV